MAAITDIRGASLGSGRHAVKEKEAVIDKSAREVALEKLLFNDPLDFAGNLQEQNKELELYGDGDEIDRQDTGSDGSHEEEDGTALDGLTDEQLFSWDTGGDTASAGQALSSLTKSKKADDEAEEDRAAWTDSDDERLTVSLASHSRLRKLRVAEAEDVIDGREYSRRLRDQYEMLHPTPDWAQLGKHRRKRRRLSRESQDGDSENELSGDEDMEEDLAAAPLASLLQSSESLLGSGAQPGDSDNARPLRSGTIDMRRLRDVGNTQPSTIESLSFHPTVSPPLILSSGPSGLLSMHHISSISGTSSSQPSSNPLLTSLHVRRLAVSTAAFHPSGTRIFFGGRRSYFHLWDLPTGTVSRVSRFAGDQISQRYCDYFKLSPCGRYVALRGNRYKGGGCANILDATTGQWIGQARVEGNGGVIDLAWWADGEGLVILGKSGEVVEYSMEEKGIVARWRDEGAVGSTVIALGGRLSRHERNSKSLGPSRWVAIGSQSGIVNIYDRANWSRGKLATNPTPRKALEQLVTTISALELSPDGQVLVMASRWKRDALRLVHLPSCTVYKNWPTSNTPLGRISSVSWAPNSKLLAVGNEQGKIRLFEVRG